MATQSSTPQPPDQTLPQILAALQSIAAAVNRGTDVIVDAADERPASQEQSTAIVDYLVLRELVGRQADEVRRTVGATRFSDQVVEFDGEIPANAVTVAVFTRRSVAPDEVADIEDVGPILDRRQEAAKDPRQRRRPGVRVRPRERHRRPADRPARAARRRGPRRGARPAPGSRDLTPAPPTRRGIPCSATWPD